MLDVSCHGVSFSFGDDRFALHDISATFPKSSHTAIAGPPGCGASTLLRLIAGELRPDSGEIRIGTRVVNTLRASRRPLLYVTSELDVAGRWSVQHALVNAVRTRTLDRADRFQELSLASSKWQLDGLLERRVSTLSSSERVRLHLARIELLRPGILVADRLLENASPAARNRLADDFYRSLRVLGTTVISALASNAELGMTDGVVVLDEGRVLQSGSAAHVFSSPASEAAAAAMGHVNVVPLRIDGTRVESVIGEWIVDTPPFSGSGVALARPDDFFVAASGEESDLIFGLEEASFEGGRWIVRGLLTGGIELRVTLAREVAISKGKLLALRYDPRRFTLLARPEMQQPSGVPTDIVPPMRESR